MVANAWEADRDHKVANTLETSYDVGSVGKLFTQIAILQLGEAGESSLDNPSATARHHGDVDGSNDQCVDQADDAKVVSHSGRHPRAPWQEGDPVFLRGWARFSAGQIYRLLSYF